MMRTALLRSLALVACTGGTDDPTDTDSTDPTDTTDTTDTTTDTTDTTEPTGDTGTTDPFTPAPPDLDIENENNYAFEQAWAFPTAEVRAGFDITVDWGEVNEDAYGVDRAATSYDAVVLLNVGVTSSDFIDRWNTDALNGSSSDLLGVWTTEIDGVSFTRLSDLVDPDGDAFEPANFLVEQSSVTWFVGIGDMDEGRIDVRMGAFIVPQTTGTASRVELEDGQTELTWSATLDAPSVVTNEVHDRFTADWRGADTTVYGTDYDQFLVDELVIGYWADVTSPTELADDVLDLEATATRLWTADIEGDRDILLELARDANRQNFGGFEAGGTWLIGGRCSTCYGRAPWWLTVVEVEPGPEE